MSKTRRSSQIANLLCRSHTVVAAAAAVTTPSRSALPQPGRQRQLRQLPSTPFLPLVPLTLPRLLSTTRSHVRTELQSHEQEVEAEAEAEAEAVVQAEIESEAQAETETELETEPETDPVSNSEKRAPIAAAAAVVQEHSTEDRVRQARLRFGDVLPKHYLSEREYAVYKRYYGIPVFTTTTTSATTARVGGGGEGEGERGALASELQNGADGETRLPEGTTVVLRESEDGGLEEVEIDGEEESEQGEENGEETGEEGEEESGRNMTPEEWYEYRERKAQAYHQTVYENSQLAREEVDREKEEEDEENEEENEDEDEDEDDFMRAHPLTLAGRSRPYPSTIFLPKATVVDPTTLLLTRANHKHLSETIKRIFGGPALPFSASTPPARLGKEQKAIPLDPSQSTMSQIDADAYMAAVQPGVHATIMSALVEVRRRLGSAWLEHVLRDKKGGTILDAGAGGMGVLVWNEVLSAEWQRMHEESGNTSQDATPVGKATVLIASDTLRHRMSKLLENTTFIPRLPDTAPREEEGEEAVNARQPQKRYDLIIAPHTLWPLRQDYQRKEVVEKYWSLLNPKGGVLLLMEKGLPRGFEVVAAARSHLLSKYISSPGSDRFEASVDSQVSRPDGDSRFGAKERGMIIAPCTNHSSCPMYQSVGVRPGRKDFCYFSQRYIRPPYLQRILNATDKNHEDVQFSYLAVQRGRDQRRAEHDLLGKGFSQSAESTEAAFRGHEWSTPVSDAEQTTTTTTTEEEKDQSRMTSAQELNLLTLPRVVLPPLKRRGHIILDVCTPAGTLERWTVPRSFSKQAFRDARKARWGDLWALGAKTRIPRPVRLGRPSDTFDRQGRKMGKPRKLVIEVAVDQKDGQPVEAARPRIQAPRGKRASELLARVAGGRYTSDRKIRGSGGRKGRRRRREGDAWEDAVLDDL